MNVGASPALLLQRMELGRAWGLQTAELVRLALPASPEAVQDLVSSLAQPAASSLGPSVVQVLQERAADATSAALMAAAALSLQGRPPLLLKLFARDGFDHVLALFLHHGRWGAVSGAGSAGGGWRDPVYCNLRELVMSYLHEYGHDGRKTLLGYGDPFDLRRLDPQQWITAEQGGLAVERRLSRWGFHALYDPAGGWLRDRAPA